MTHGMSDEWLPIDQLCVNVIRTLTMDAVQTAKSGHPGAPMGMAPAAYVLWSRLLKHNPANPLWPDRDRFVLSGGHASMLLYSLLNLTGYDVSLEDLKSFRKLGSKTPGHPEYGHTPGVETTTGPLGQGLANAVGMAMAERHLAVRFNRPDAEIVDHYTYVMCGDGDLMEGVAAEAASLAGHLGLSKLICIYDDNQITIEGRTDISFTEDVGLRFQAYNWQVLKVADGNDLTAIQEAIEAAQADTQRPSLIAVRTQIAFGSPNKQGSSDAHGAPLGEDEVCLTKECLGCPRDEIFCVPDDAADHCRKAVPKGKVAEDAWHTVFNAYSEKHPDLAAEWHRAIDDRLPPEWDRGIPDFEPQDGPLATRAASGRVLNALASEVRTLIGGSADLAPSNKTLLEDSHDFQKGSYDGRNIRFGVREHAMGAILSGLYLHKGLRPYGGTFLVFADYMRPAIRLAGLMHLPIIYVFTHDSIAVGEDGPTHQPVEHLASLRAIPNLTVIRPADAGETAAAWRQAMLSIDRPVALILSRQKLPILDRSRYAPADDLSRGAYVLCDCEGRPDILLIASGSEIHITLEAQQALAAKNIAARVISMPSWELFENQSPEYREAVLPAEISARIAVEAGLPMGWRRFVGERGAVIGIDHYGTSAPGGTLMEKYGFTAADIVRKAIQMLGR